MNDYQLRTVKSAAITFTDSRERWEKLARTGATDAQIVDELNHNFGSGGGSGGPDQITEWHKSKPPRIWFNVVRGDRPDVSGKELVSAIRYIFGIDAPGQMRLL